MATRGEALAAFDAARDAFVGAYEGVPDEALAWLRKGDDYALGGLVTHCVTVLDHYLMVLDGLLRGGFTPMRARDPDGFWEASAARAKTGVTPEQRGPVFAELASRHAAFVTAAHALPEGDWERKADVVYGDAPDPYPTSPADVCGWLLAHYLEHVPQVSELHEEWQRTADG